METLEPLVERASGIKPAKHAAGHTYCPKCKTVIANKCNVNSLNFCHKCGQALTPDERGKTYTWDNAVEAGEEFCPIFNKKSYDILPKRYACILSLHATDS